MTQITLQNAEKSWAEILQKTLNGEEIIIERDGIPVVKLSPIINETEWFGMDDGRIWIAEDFDDTPDEFSEIIGETEKK